MTENTDKILCSICLNDFKEPKLLDCKHRFCLTCLDNYIKKVTIDNHFPCPLCGLDINIPDGGVIGFDTNYQLEEVEVPKCDVCKSGISSDFRCEDCHQNLCITCRKFHDTLTVTRNHVVVEYDKPSEKENRDKSADPSGENPEPTHKDFCSIHHDRIADYYCKKCMVGVCCRCVVASHNGHMFVDLLDEKIHDETREELNTLKGSLETQVVDFQNHLDSLNKIINDINQSSKVTCRYVDSQVKKICSRIKKLGEDMKDKIHKYQQDELKKCTEKLEQTKVLPEKLKASVKCSENILANYSTVEGLKRISQVKREIPSSWLLNLPVVSYTWFEEGIVNDRTLDNHLGVLKNLNGPTLRSSFKVDEEKMMDNGLYGDDYYIQGIPCRLNVKKLETDGDVYLGIYLCMDISKDSNIKSWKVKSSEKLNNWKNKQCAVARIENKISLYTSTDSIWGWGNVIKWQSFVYQGSGFVDKDGIFSVQVTVNVVESERS